jgi:hypothetical protein
MSRNMLDPVGSKIKEYSKISRRKNALLKYTTNEYRMIQKNTLPVFSGE